MVAKFNLTIVLVENCKLAKSGKTVHKAHTHKAIDVETYMYLHGTYKYIYYFLKHFNVVYEYYVILPLNCSGFTICFQRQIYSYVS